MTATRSTCPTSYNTTIYPDIYSAQYFLLYFFPSGRDGQGGGTGGKERERDRKEKRTGQRKGQEREKERQRQREREREGEERQDILRLALSCSHGQPASLCAVLLVLDERPSPKSRKRARNRGGCLANLAFDTASHHRTYSSSVFRLLCFCRFCFPLAYSLSREKGRLMRCSLTRQEKVNGRRKRREVLIKE